jgi:hypothetical protein
MGPVGLTGTTGNGLDTIQCNLPTSGVVLPAGLAQTDVTALATFLTSNTDLYAATPFDEVTTWYSILLSAFSTSSTSDTSRLTFVTNLPHWSSTATSGTQASTALSCSFLAAVTDTTYRNPAALRAYLAPRVVQQLSSSVTALSGSALEGVLYRQQTFNVDGLHLGPFQRTNCLFNTTLDYIVCRNFTNAGANAMYMWSCTQVKTPATPAVVGPYAPSIQTVPVTPPIVNRTTTTSTTTTTTTAPTSSTSTSTTTTTTCPPPLARPPHPRQQHRILAPQAPQPQRPQTPHCSSHQQVETRPRPQRAKGRHAALDADVHRYREQHGAVGDGTRR